MAFAPHLIRDAARTRRGVRTRREVAPTAPRRFVRRSALGTEAVYELIEEGRELVTAEVVTAPGLAPGTRVRLLASAVRAMDEVEPDRLVRLARLPHVAVDNPPRAA